MVNLHDLEYTLYYSSVKSSGRLHDSRSFSASLYYQGTFTCTKAKCNYESSVDNHCLNYELCDNHCFNYESSVDNRCLQFILCWFCPFLPHSMNVSFNVLSSLCYFNSMLPKLIYFRSDIHFTIVFSILC